MTDELIFHAGQRIEIKPGYQALVRFVKLEATPREVCEKLLTFNVDTGRKGDLRDIQRLAEVALGKFDEPEEEVVDEGVSEPT